MILIAEAVERFNTAGREYGVRVRPWSRRKTKASKAVSDIEKLIAPLELPLELRSFWNQWNPASIEWPCLDGFLALESIPERRLRELPISPTILLPIADWTNSQIWIELASEGHPGGRIFRGGNDDTHVDLWSFGLSGLLEMLALGFEQDMIDERLGGLHCSHLEALATRQVREHVSSLSPRRIEAIDRGQFPDHWLEAEGLTKDLFELRGATHTVASYKEARQSEPEIRATLRGHFQNTICGGNITGCVGSLTDDTGTVYIFVPLSQELTGALGRDGEVEVDVISLSSSGEDTDYFHARAELGRVAATRRHELGREAVVRLTRQLRELDTTTLATGLRSIR